MLKKSIVYSLTDRGFFSELSNLALAKVYAEYYGFTIIVNDRNWNVRYKEGWSDYFLSTIKTTKNIFSAQLKIYTNEKPWIGKFYYKPKEFYPFYFYYIINIIYRSFFPNIYLTRQIFHLMRSESFFKDELGKKHFKLISESFKSLYKYNSDIKDRIDKMKSDNKLPNKYISVHIRRGDKITSGEMDNIDLSVYIDEILKNIGKSNNVYIATDDISIIDSICSHLSSYGFNIYYNKDSSQEGFDESMFNTKHISERYKETLMMLYDFDVLIHSVYFIGTYTSNIDRTVPYFLGLENCCSIDKEWNFLNS